MDKTVIAVMGGHLHAGTDEYDYADHAYCQRLVEAGALPLILPAVGEPSDVQALLQRCGGVLFPGGADVDPQFYRQEPCPQLGALDSSLDRCWIAAVQAAVELRLPVLGICRGMQLVNVALGGTLSQDIRLDFEHPLQHAQKHNPSAALHQVRLAQGSRLAGLLGTDALYTNSTHHQCVLQPAPGLHITARTSDGVPEALESDDGQFLLVQWHPESLRITDQRMQRIFDDLVFRAASRP